jgi:N-acetylmuramoyl-L-alanine amidase
VEVSCLSNESEAELLATPEYKENIASALLKGIRLYADTLHQANEKVSENETDE